jgi:hypothetical protein
MGKEGKRRKDLKVDEDNKEKRAIECEEKERTDDI